MQVELGRLTARATLSTQVQTSHVDAFSRDGRFLVGSLSLQELSLAPSPVPETLVMRQLVLLRPRSLCPPSSPRVCCACAVAHDATPQLNNGLLCQHYAWCFESLLCLTFCRHKILTPIGKIRTTDHYQCQKLDWQVTLLWQTCQLYLLANGC